MTRPHSHPFLSHHHPLLSLLSSSASTAADLAFSRLITSGLARHPFVASKLVSHLLLLSPPPLPLALSVLRNATPQPTLFTYNTLIKSSPSPLPIFRSLLHDSHVPGLLPNQYTFAFLLRGLGEAVGDEGEVEQAMGQAVRRGLEGNVYVANVLVRVYGRLGRVADARKVFEDCPVTDLVSWNSLVGVYVGVGDMNLARDVFDEMAERDVISWSTVIAGYVQVGSFVEAMELFRKMQLAGTTANEFTLTSILAACANLVALEQGKWVHAYMNKSKVKLNERLLASLIDMYAKCGEIEFASKIFCECFPKRTVRPWNAMLSGYAIHGFCDEATDLFERMEAERVSPNKVTFISLLHACSHGKLVEKGRSYFNSMTSLGICPEIEHYGCMVDLLGRAGQLKQAEDFILGMPIAPDTIIWATLLGACRIHGEIEMVKRIDKIIRELEPKYVGCQVLLANIYCGSGRWTDAKDVRNKIELAGRKKTPGCSSIELDGMFHQFLVGDRSHPQTKQIYSFLEEMAIKLKLAGYVPGRREVLLDIDEEDKDTALSRHSEKLAIAFGLMNTKEGTTIRILKNLRVCTDCHHATKFISKVYDREIIVRDRIRFHHFKHGLCSCKDYW